MSAFRIGDRVRERKGATLRDLFPEIKGDQFPDVQMVGTVSAVTSGGYLVNLDPGQFAKYYTTPGGLERWPYTEDELEPVSTASAESKPYEPKPAFAIGTRVREIAGDTTVAADTALRFLYEMLGHDWSEVPAQLEGVVVGVSADTDARCPGQDFHYTIRYDNAPAWAPQTCLHHADQLEEIK